MAQFMGDGPVTPSQSLIETLDSILENPQDYGSAAVQQASTARSHVLNLFASTHGIDPRDAEAILSGQDMDSDDGGPIERGQVDKQGWFSRTWGAIKEVFDTDGRFSENLNQEKIDQAGAAMQERGAEFITPALLADEREEEWAAAASLVHDRLLTEESPLSREEKSTLRVILARISKGRESAIDRRRIQEIIEQHFSGE